MFHADHPELHCWDAPAGLVLVEDTCPQVVTSDFNKELIDISISLGEFAATVRQALQDGRVSYAESKELFKIIGTMRREIAEVESLLRKHGYSG